MEEWQAKPTESYTEIFKYLKKVFREIKSKIKFPQPIPKLHDIYKEYLTKDYQNKMYEECPDLRSLGDENVEKLFEHHVLNPLSTKNFIILQKKVENMVSRFLAELEFAGDIDENAIKDYIDENVEENDEAILVYVKKVPRDEDLLDEMTYLILNKKLQEILTVVGYAQRAVYTKYQLSDYYISQIEKIKETTIQLIITELDITYGKLLRDVTKVLKKSLEFCLKEYRDKYEEELVEMYLKDPKVSNYMKSHKTIFENLLRILEEKVAEELGEAPNEVFLFEYAKELKETLEKSIIIDKLYNTVIQDPTILKNTVYAELTEMFDDFFIFGKIFQLFDEWKLGGIKRTISVCKITLLTDYVEYHEERYSMYLEILERVYKSFLEEYSQQDKSIKEIWEMINTKENYICNRPKLDHMLAQEIEFWNKEVDLSANLFALMSVFLAFNVVRAENMSTRYTNHLRCMLKNVFRNFQNGMYRFTNFQILCALESLIIEYKTKIKSKSLIRLESTILQREILENIRKTSIHSFDEQAEHKEQLASIEAQIQSNIPKPNKFIFEKISDPTVKSKSIIICISGWTSEDCIKSKEWRGIQAAFPNTEMIALHWRSSTMNALFEYVVNEANEVSKAKEGLIFGFALPSFQSLTLGVMAYKAIKGLASDQWGQCNKEAITTGIYLAHILAETDLFKDYVINFMAFSLGTMVVMNCIWELERMNRHDIIYDVLLLGGVINVGDFNEGAMSVIGHKLINCYCYNDCILRYILKAADFGTNPIGLGTILSSNKKVENLNVTKEVSGHNNYRDNLFRIMAMIDFNEDYRYMLTE